MLVVVAIDQKTYPSRLDSHDQGGIHISDMIAHQQGGPSIGQVLQARRANPVNAFENHRSYKPHQEVRQRLESDQNQAQGHDAGHHETARWADGQVTQSHQQESRDENSQKTQEAIQCQNFSQALSRAVPLNEGDQWYDEKATAKAHQSQNRAGGVKMIRTYLQPQ